MSVMLMGSSIVTTMLIRRKNFKSAAKPADALYLIWRTLTAASFSARFTTSRRF
jgi:hypothetical protein